MLVNSDPEIHRGGFKAAMRELYAAESDCDFPPAMGFLPDAYKLDRERKIVALYEVEDTHPIPATKLKALADFWFAMDADDSHDWLPELKIVDRYGNIGPEVDLCATWYAFLCGRAA